jgi:hypothetical protein
MSDKKNLLDDRLIQSKIHTIRGLQVMLDRDLAELYEVKSIRLREQVRRNIDRFPEDFMFILTEKEVSLMVTQNAIPSKQKLGGYLPYVFTEQGVASISGVLTNKTAIEINIQIMRAFVQMRRFISTNAMIFQRLDNIEQKQLITDTKFDKIFKVIEANEIKPIQGIFFEGQIFEAYVFISDLIKSAKSSIILIDNYVDDSVLTLFSKREENCSVTIYTKEITKQLKLDLKKYNEQYPDIEIKELKQSHDRFLILDNKIIYHIGASLKDLGKKWFAFSKFEKGVIEVLSKLNEL